MSPQRSDITSRLPDAYFSLTKESVLRVLDFEIERFQDEQHRPGWSVWALYGGLSAALWLLVDQVSSTTFHLTKSAQIFIALSAVMSARHFLGYLQQFGKTTPERTPGFQWAPDSTNRLEIIRSIFKNLLIAVCALIFTSGIHWYYYIPTSLIYGFCGLLGLVALLLSMFRLPISRVEPRLRGSRQIVAGIVLWSFGIGILSMIAFGYGSALIVSTGLTSATDARAAMLLVAFLFLLRLLAEDYSSSPLLLSLVETRRELAFGKLSASVAIEQAEIAILGMNESIVLQEDLRSVLQRLETTEKLFAEANAIIVELGSIPARETGGRDPLIVRLKEIHTSYPQVSADLDKRMKALIRKSSLLGDTPTSRAALSEMSKKIDDARSRLISRAEQLYAECDRVIKTLQDEQACLRGEGNK